MTSLSFQGRSGYISAWPEWVREVGFDLVEQAESKGGVDFKVLNSEESTRMGVRDRDWVPRVHPETGVQQVGGKWIAATPDDALHYFEDEAGRVSEVGSRIIAL